MYVPGTQEITDGILDFRQKLNHIESIAESTCNDRWTILAKTALPAAADSLWMLLVPDPKQILQNYLRPLPNRGGRKGLHRHHGEYRRGRKGRRRWWRNWGFPDTDEAIANIIPGNRAVKGRYAPALERFIWSGIDVLDELGWYYLLIEVSDNFISAWHSGIMQSRFCSNAWPYEFLATPTKSYHEGGGGAWDLAADANVLTQGGWKVISNGRIEWHHPQSPYGLVDLTISVTGQGTEGDVGFWAAEIIVTQGITDLPFVGDHRAVKPGKRVEMHVTTPQLNADTIAFRLAYFGGDPSVTLTNLEANCLALMADQS